MYRLVLDESPLRNVRKIVDATFRIFDPPDPAYSRHPFTAEYVDLAWDLLDRSLGELELFFFE